MKRQLILRIVPFLLVLAVSGWSNLYAAAFCPHMGFAAAANRPAERPSAKMPRGHHCHHTATSFADPALKNAQQFGDWTKPDLATGAAISSEQTCENCSMSRQTTVGLTAAAVGVNATPGPQINSALTVGLAVSDRRSSLIQFRQGAPPGNRPRTHLINSTFLI